MSSLSLFAQKTICSNHVTRTTDHIQPSSVTGNNVFLFKKTCFISSPQPDPPSRSACFGCQWKVCLQTSMMWGALAQITVCLDHGRSKASTFSCLLGRNQLCPEFSSISSLAKKAQLVNTLPVPESVPECLTVPNLFFFGSLVDQTQLRQHKELAEDILWLRWLA
jgi:hypothetical protein